MLSFGYVFTCVVPRNVHGCVNGLQKVSSLLGAAQWMPDLRLEPISASSPHVVLMICPWEQWVRVATVPSQAVRHQPGARPTPRASTWASCVSPGHTGRLGSAEKSLCALGPESHLVSTPFASSAPSPATFPAFSAAEAQAGGPSMLQTLLVVPSPALPSSRGREPFPMTGDHFTRMKARAIGVRPGAS